MKKGETAVGNFASDDSLRPNFLGCRAFWLLPGGNEYENLDEKLWMPRCLFANSTMRFEDGKVQTQKGSKFWY